MPTASTSSQASIFRGVGGRRLHHAEITACVQYSMGSAATHGRWGGGRRGARAKIRRKHDEAPPPSLTTLRLFSLQYKATSLIRLFNRWTYKNKRRCSISSTPYYNSNDHSRSYELSIFIIYHFHFSNGYFLTLDELHKVCNNVGTVKNE